MEISVLDRGGRNEKVSKYLRAGGARGGGEGPGGRHQQRRIRWSRWQPGGQFAAAARLKHSLVVQGGPHLQGRRQCGRG